MKAMVLNGHCDLKREDNPLRQVERRPPSPEDDQILIKVSACGVCHTELDEIEGRTPPPRFPIIPGHQVVGRVAESGKGAGLFKIGDRVGVAWIFSSCGRCKWCLKGQDNLCPEFRATGRDADGGYAEYMVVPEESAYAIPEIFSDEEATPLLCAGAVGYRALKLTGIENGQILALTGFGASGHMNLLMAKAMYPASPVFVFARNPREREFAMELGADWSGDTEDAPPERPDAFIDTTPVWKPPLEALKRLAPGGRLVINAIRKENSDATLLSELDYGEALWMEKEIKSVANVSKTDVRQFLALAAEVPIRPEFETFPLRDANKALLQIKRGLIRGAKVLTINHKV